MTQCRLVFGLTAIALLLTGCASAPAPNAAQLDAHASTALGMKRLASGNYRQAINAFEPVLARDGENEQANWGMALAYQGLQQPDQARSYYQRIVGANADPKIVNSYAVYLCRQGESKRALSYFRRAADDQRNQQPATVLANAGLCLAQSGDGDGARHYYQQALLLDKDEFTALVGMARSRYQQGEYLSARAFVERADAQRGLDAPMLLLAARVELALGKEDVAQRYLQRHNERKPTESMTIEQVRQPG